MGNFQIGETISKKWAKVETTLAMATTFILYMVVVLIGAEICLRKFLNVSIPELIEVTEFLMVVMIYSSLAYAQKQKANIHVDLILTRVRDSSRDILEAMSAFLGAVLFGLIAWQGALHTWNDFILGERTFGRPSIVTWPHKLFIPLGSALLVFRFLLDITVLLTKGRKRDS
jgi:TRAP-type C4-dicarboxylate transport system permease small subunit